MPKLAKSEIADIVNPYLEFYPQRDRAIIKDRIVQCIAERQKMILRVCYDIDNRWNRI